MEVLPVFVLLKRVIRSLLLNRAITSVFHSDPITHVEIVKYPDNSNAMKLFFGLSEEGSSTVAGKIIKLVWKKKRSE